MQTASVLHKALVALRLRSPGNRNTGAGTNAVEEAIAAHHWR
jgi:hypothetical protein